ncbi:MAG: hypothetical protein GEV03_20245 [Streptosporangiales bacterium]|nr:hypothetical protein [Streptosporangiales bacterium]
MPGLAFDHDSVRRVDETTSAVDTPSGTVLLDLDSGERRPAGRTVGWCVEDGEHTPAQKIKDRNVDYLRVNQWTPCGPGGKPAGRPGTAPDFAGAARETSSPGCRRTA